MSVASQLSLAAGEVTEEVYPRVDTVKHATGLRTLRNMYVMRHGGATSRPGTEFVGEVYRDGSTPGDLTIARGIPWEFNDDQAYVLEFGSSYMKVIRQGAYVEETAQSITSVSKAAQALVTKNAHGLSDGDEIAIVAIGMTELNGRNFVVSDKTTNDFKLKHLDGTYVNSTAFTTFVSGNMARLFRLSTLISDSIIPTLYYVQNADVMTLTEDSIFPKELARLAHDNWTISEIAFNPDSAQPAGLQVSGTEGTADQWVITGIETAKSDESRPTRLVGASAVASSGSPRTIVWTPYDGIINIYKKKNGIFGFIGSADGSIGATGFVDNGIVADIDITPPKDIIDLNERTQTSKTITNITQANPAVVTTSAAHGYSHDDQTLIQSVAGMTQVNNTRFRIIVLSPTTFSLRTMTGLAVDSSGYGAYTSGGTSVEIIDVPFDETRNDAPAICSYVQQRLMLARTVNEPTVVFASRSANFNNFMKSTPSVADDAIKFTMVGLKVNEIRHILDLGRPIVLTRAGEFVLEGDASGIIKAPTDVNPKQFGYNGSSAIRPLVVGGNALYVQARGGTVRDFGIEQNVDNYRGNDLTIWASHLFEGHTIIAWAYQQIPHSIIWAVRDDGVLLSLTYVREQQIFAWAKHDFDGLVEDVVSIPENDEDAVYLLLLREIDGVERRFWERMSTRKIDDIVDYIGLDCALTYDGRNTGSTTMTLSGSGWTNDTTLTLTASAAFFKSTDVGNAIFMYSATGALVICEIEAFTSTTVVTVRPDRDVPVNLRTTARTTWTRAVDSLSNIWHLEGKLVSVIGDGFVVASPNNPQYTELEVTNGAITLNRYFGVIHVGLPITCDIETLDYAIAQGETVVDKNKFISDLAIHVKESRGIFAGAKAPDDDSEDMLEGLYEFKADEPANYDDPLELVSGVIKVPLQAEWNGKGSVFIRQVDPLPLTVAAIYPGGLYPVRSA